MSIAKNFNYLTIETLAQWIEQGYIEIEGERIPFDEADIQATEYSVPVANETATATAKLTKLTINGIVYAVTGEASSVYATVSATVTAINAMAAGQLEVPHAIYIRQTDVPDLWVSKNDESTSVPYTYVSDAQFIADLKAAEADGLQMGYYRVNELETAKVFVPVQDVQINSVSILVDGVANIPIASSGILGVVRVGNANYGLTISASNGTLFIEKATNSEIDAKTQNYKPIVPANLVYATKVGMLGNTALADAEQSTIRQNIGAVTQVLVSDNL